MSRAETIIPVLALAACLAALWPLQNWIDRTQAASPDEEVLYLSSPEGIKRFALGYDAILADLYWMRAVQYFGNKAIANREKVVSGTLELKLLYPLLDVTTTLDPRNIAAYRFGGFFLYYSVSPEQAYSLLEKGIEHNPRHLRLYQDLAFFRWNAGDCEEASRIYLRAAELPRAPVWTRKMGAMVLAECGKRNVAVEQLELMLESTADPRIRKEINAKLLGYRALDEIEYLEQAVAFFRETNGRNPSSLVEVVRAVRAAPGTSAPRLRVDARGAPLDPTGVPYVYDPATGAIATVRLYLPKPIVIKGPPVGR